MKMKYAAFVLATVAAIMLMKPCASEPQLAAIGALPVVGGVTGIIGGAGGGGVGGGGVGGGLLGGLLGGVPISQLIATILDLLGQLQGGGAGNMGIVAQLQRVIADLIAAITTLSPAALISALVEIVPLLFALLGVVLTLPVGLVGLVLGLILGIVDSLLGLAGGGIGL